MNMIPQMPFEPNFEPEFNSEFDPAADQDWENFMLLSAYLDGEVSPQEIEQVEDALKQDPQFYRLYQEQCQLRQMLVEMPVSAPVDAEILIDRVLARVKVKQKRRNLGLVAAAAIATIFSGTIALINFAPREWSIANFNSPEEDESLVLAMEYPIVPDASFPFFPTQLGQ